jgi:hypothetical protein
VSVPDLLAQRAGCGHAFTYVRRSPVVLGLSQNVR